MKKSKENSRVLRNKKNNKSIFIIGFIALILLSVFVSIIYKNNFYKTHFKQNTYIVGVNISNLDVDSAYKKINDDLSNESIVLNSDSDKYEIPLNKIVSISKKNIDDYFNNNKLSNLFNISNIDENLIKEINTLNLNKNAKQNKNAEIILLNDTFIIQDEIQGTMIDIEHMIPIISNSIVNNKELNFNLNDFYKKPISKNDSRILEKLETMNKQKNVEIELNINGKKEIIPKDIILKSITNNGITDRELIPYLNNLDVKYRTKNNNIKFITHNKKELTLYSSIDYGWSIDIMKTFELIKEGILSEKNKYSIEVPIIGNGIGDTIQFNGNYAEVDLNEQKAYIFKNGKEIFKWDVITGLPNSNNMTNVGIHEVLYKESPSVLRGYNNDGTKYASPVNYWIPFNWEGEGFHDANWQVYGFGGEKYKTLGSHGCVNTSPTDMKKVWELTYQGMPVIVWGDIYNGL